MRELRRMHLVEKIASSTKRSAEGDTEMATDGHTETAAEGDTEMATNRHTETDAEGDTETT